MLNGLYKRHSSISSPSLGDTLFLATTQSCPTLSILCYNPLPASIEPLYHKAIEPLYHCAFVPLCHCTKEPIEPLYHQSSVSCHCAFVSSYHCVIVPLPCYNCAFVPLCHCTIVPLYYLHHPITNLFCQLKTLM